MRTSLIRIGNSRGIRLPQPLIRQCRLGAEVDLELRNGKIVISPVPKTRQGWEEGFKKMAAAGDDKLPEAFPASAWDREEWEWK